MRNKNLIIALLLLSAPLFAQQRSNSNRTSATLQINVLVRASIVTPPPTAKREADQGITFHLYNPPQLHATRDEVRILDGSKFLAAKNKSAVLRTVTYTVE